MGNQKIIRTFAAICLDEEIRDRISELQAYVKKFASDVKWVEPANFHVTLKFLGDVTTAGITYVQNALDEVGTKFSAFDLTVAGTGVFPTLKRPRIVWVGVKNGREQLSVLAGAVEDALVKAGFEKEEKPFRSHITIGRIRESRPDARLVEGLNAVESDDLGAQRVSSIVLMESVLRSGGPAYKPLSVHKLAGSS